MLRDEAIDWLLRNVESDTQARLQINVSHGNFRAMYLVRPHEPDEVKTVGEWTKNLTDALAALIEAMP